MYRAETVIVEVLITVPPGQSLPSTDVKPRTFTVHPLINSLLQWLGRSARDQFAKDLEILYKQHIAATTRLHIGEVPKVAPAEDVVAAGTERDILTYCHGELWILKVTIWLIYT